MQRPVRKGKRGRADAFESQYLRDAACPVRKERVDLASYAEELLPAYEAMDAWLRGAPLAYEYRRAGVCLGPAPRI